MIPQPLLRQCEKNRKAQMPYRMNKGGERTKGNLEWYDVKDLWKWVLQDLWRSLSVSISVFLMKVGLQVQLHLLQNSTVHLWALYGGTRHKTYLNPIIFQKDKLVNICLRSDLHFMHKFCWFWGYLMCWFQKWHSFLAQIKIKIHTNDIAWPNPTYLTLCFHFHLPHKWPSYLWSAPQITS